jgi:hypothetical protein
MPDARHQVRARPRGFEVTGFRGCGERQYSVVYIPSKSMYSIALGIMRKAKYRRGEAISDETFHLTPEREYLQAK